MKRAAAVFLCGAMVCTGGVMADKVIETVPDTLPGKGFGALSGFMAGSMIGGPLGAMAGTVVGAWAGGVIQESSGLHRDAYRVERADGSHVVVRSPQRAWSPGDQVAVVDGRLAVDR